MRFLCLSFLLLLCAVLHPSDGRGQFYSGSHQSFGKNRVQFKAFDWQFYPDDKFEVYHYLGGKKLAQYTLFSAKKQLPDIERILDYPLGERIQIVVYNKQSEFLQSNVGIGNEDQYNIGGQSYIVGSKMFVYFEGDHASLDRQIRSNLTDLIFSRMMYGGNWREVLKSSTLLNIPSWYKEGLKSYLAEPWSDEMASHVYDAIAHERYKNFNHLEGNEAVEAGHAIWKFIADVYGENVIPNILYMTRISRNIENGFLFVLGLNMKTLSEEFQKYHEEQLRKINKTESIPNLPLLLTDKQKTEKETILSINDETQANKKLARFEGKLQKKQKKSLGQLQIKYKEKYRYDHFTDSPDGTFVAYSTNEMGQSKVWIYDKSTGKKKRILKRDKKLDRNSDLSYPILAWHPSGLILTYVYESKGRVFLGNYDLENKTNIDKELFRIDKVIDMDYASNGRKIIFSGVREGQSDLYLYQVIGNVQEQLTFDIYDDMHPRFIPGSDHVIFASNRPDENLNHQKETDLFNLNKDLFLIDLDYDERQLERITSTPDIDENSPWAYDKKNYTYLRKFQGSSNRYIASIDSSISQVDTLVHYRYFTNANPLSQFNSSPYSYQFNALSGQYNLCFYKNKRLNYFEGNRQDDRIISEEMQNGKAHISQLNGQEVLVFQPKTNIGEIDTDNYEFENEKRDYTYEKETILISELGPQGEIIADTENDSIKYVLPKPSNYRLNFSTDVVVTQIDNTFSNQFYQLRSGVDQAAPGLSPTFSLGISDLFEDKKIYGGMRLSLDLDNSDIGIAYADLSKRLDKTLSFQRQSMRIQRNSVVPQVIRLHTHLLRYELKWPLDEIRSIRGTAIVRVDRAVQVATDPRSIGVPNEYDTQTGLKVAYVYDNSLKKGLNLYHGTRYKLFAEYYQSPGVASSDFKVIGMDFRHYHKIHRNIILALRAAGSTSFGSRKLLNYAGGVDNWIPLKSDNSIPVSPDQNYFYQTLSTPIRGFFANSRNGNSFGLVNAEIRWPIIRYFSKKPLKSDFFENFQLVGFADMGSAWTGPSPYSKENAFNTKVITQNPITVRIESNQDPVIYGYGFGVRSRVLGYFVRLDWAWGIDDGIILPRVFYFSLDFDF